MAVTCKVTMSPASVSMGRTLLGCQGITDTLTMCGRVHSVLMKTIRFYDRFRAFKCVGMGHRQQSSLNPNFRDDDVHHAQTHTLSISYNTPPRSILLLACTAQPLLPKSQAWRGGNPVLMSSGKTICAVIWVLSASMMSLGVKRYGLLILFIKVQMSSRFDAQLYCRCCALRYRKRNLMV